MINISLEKNMQRLLMLFLLSFIATSALFSNDTDDSVLKKARQKYDQRNVNPSKEKQAPSSGNDTSNSAGESKVQISENLEFLPFCIEFVPGLPSSYIQNWTPIALGVIGSNPGQVIGVQAAGIFSLAKKITGVQFAGVFNAVNSNQNQGAQFSGVMNVVEGSLQGAQFSGVINLTSNNFSGAQFAGILNSTGGTQDGISVGLINIANIHKGVSFGLVNIAEQNDGLLLGLINIAKNRINELNILWVKGNYLEAGFKTGGSHWFTYLWARTGLDGLATGDKMAIWNDGSFGYQLGYRLIDTKSKHGLYIDAQAGIRHFIPQVEQSSLDLRGTIGLYGGKMAIFAGIDTYLNIPSSDVAWSSVLTNWGTDWNTASDAIIQSLINSMRWHIGIRL
jgi:hypothetical protein